MKITVRECLELRFLKDAIVAGGKAGLDNKVTAVSFFDWGTIGKPVLELHKRDEMILAPLLSVQEDFENSLQLIRGLADAGVAALVLFPFNGFAENFKKAIETLCDELGLPVLFMPEDTKIAYSDVINEVMEKVLYGDNFGNRLISNTIFHLLNFEKHSSFQSAVREAAINNNFQIILLSEDYNPIFSVETRHRATIADAIREGIQRGVGKSMVYTKIDVNGVLTYWGPVTIDGQKLFMLIVDNEDSYSPGEITKLAEIVEISMGMWKYSPEGDAKAEFIKALRRGNKSLAYSIKDEAGVAGEDIVSVFSLEGIEKDEGLKILSSFEKKWGSTVLTIHEGDEICGMILSNSEGFDNDACMELYSQLEKSKLKILFHVTGVDGIEGAGDAYHLINEAWPFIQHIFPQMTVFSKYELALASNCISISLKGDTVKKNYMDLLEPFNRLSDSRGKQLLETLEIFMLDAGMNTAKTAKMMKVHANTVQYRIKRIKEILNADIMETTIMPGLIVALAIDRMEKIIK